MNLPTLNCSPLTDELNLPMNLPHYRYGGYPMNLPTLNCSQLTDELASLPIWTIPDELASFTEYDESVNGNTSHIR
jgi:hypothetical protein